MIDFMLFMLFLLMFFETAFIEKGLATVTKHTTPLKLVFFSVLLIVLVGDECFLTIFTFVRFIV